MNSGRRHHHHRCRPRRRRRRHCRRDSSFRFDEKCLLLIHVTLLKPNECTLS